MSSVRPEETIDALADRFPAFARSIDLEEGPYSILGDFAIHVRDNIESDAFTAADLDKVFEFLNELGSSENREVQNQLVVGILEILTDTEKCVETARRKLRGQALELFERVLIGWNHA